MDAALSAAVCAVKKARRMNEKRAAEKVPQRSCDRIYVLYLWALSPRKWQRRRSSIKVSLCMASICSPSLPLWLINPKCLFVVSCLAWPSISMVIESVFLFAKLARTLYSCVFDVHRRQLIKAELINWFPYRARVLKKTYFFDVRTKKLNSAFILQHRPCLECPREQFVCTIWWSVDGEKRKRDEKN